MHRLLFSVNFFLLILDLILLLKLLPEKNFVLLLQLLEFLLPNLDLLLYLVVDTLSVALILAGADMLFRYLFLRIWENSWFVFVLLVDFIQELKRSSLQLQELFLIDLNTLWRKCSNGWWSRYIKNRFNARILLRVWCGYISADIIRICFNQKVPTIIIYLLNDNLVVNLQGLLCF